jgi:signal peptide peptidase SppA
MSELWPNPSCAANHLGAWFCYPVWMQQALAMVKAGLRVPMKQMEDDDDPRDRPLYRNADGIALIGIAGPMSKGMSKFGGTSTLRVRQALRAASADEKVSGILIVGDSPGGTVAGAAELHTDVQAAGAVKPTWTFIEDMGCSGMIYTAVGSSKILANRAALVGSCGTISMLYDTSKQAEIQGVEAVPITGRGESLKAQGADGLAFSDEFKAEVQAIVDDADEMFRKAVQKGRGFSKAQTDAVFTGGVWTAPQAKELGLIDGITTLEDAVNQLRREAKRSASSRDAAGRRLRIAES